MSKIRYSLPSGAIVWIEDDKEEAGAPGIESAYGREDVGAGNPGIVGKFKDALSPLEEVVKLLMESVSSAAQKPTSITLEFGVNLKGKAGIQLVSSGEVGAELKITLAWGESHE
jgi:Trypsin-co-occurring domain 1